MADRVLRLGGGRIVGEERNARRLSPEEVQLVSLLDRKLLRDINAMRGQVITIALLVAAGVAVFVASVSTYRFAACRLASNSIATARFPQIFVALKRAPLSIVPRLNAVPGVAVGRAAHRARRHRGLAVRQPAGLGADGFARPCRRRDARAAASAPRHGARSPAMSTSAAINEAFAEANRHKARRRSIRVVLNGRLQSFDISGIALSPEYVYAVKPGLPIPDDRFFAMLWVDRSGRGSGIRHEGRLQRRSWFRWRQALTRRP